MNIVVCLKQILDPLAPAREFRVDNEKKEAVRGAASLVTNIFCENAIETALQTKEKLGAGKITALGKGNTQPVTKPGDCPRGKLSNAVLFACLHPDRRVEIEVSGAKSIDPSTPATVAPSEPKAKAVGSTSNALAKAKAGKAKPRPKNKILIGQ